MQMFYICLNTLFCFNNQTISEAKLCGIGLSVKHHIFINTHQSITWLWKYRY